MKKILVFILVLVLCAMSFSVFACGDDPENENKPTGDKEATNTGFSIVKDDKVLYKIVIPKNADYYEKFASEELVEFLEQSTGLTFSVVEESGSLGESNIYLGRTNKLKEKSVAVDEKKLTASGYVIKVIGKDVFICGGSSLGTLYGVYEFLKQEIGFEVYAEDEICFNTGVKNLLLKNLDLVDIPDIEWRQVMCVPLYNNKTSASRMRLNMSSDVFMCHTTPWHNSFLYVSPTDFLNDHQSWFGDGTQVGTREYNQLCYTAHGDAVELALLREQVLSTMKSIVKTNFDNGNFLNYITFTQEDEGGWCKCDTCTKLIKNYNGCGSATLIQFLNPIAKDLNKWIDEFYPGHNVTVVTFAYQETEEAPVKSDNNGGYVAIDETVKPNEYLSVMYAMFYADYFEPLTSNSNNAYYTTLKKWSSITNKISLWSYNANFSNYMTFHDSFSSMSANYKLFKECKTFYLFDQGVYNMGESVTGFTYLKAYLNSKLSWNTDLVFNDLVDDFFDHFYLDAQDKMRDMYDMARIYVQKQHSLNGMQGRATVPDNVEAKYWERGFLESIIHKAEEAYTTIAYLKDYDIVTYNKIYDRITLERIPYEFLLLKNYMYDISSSERQEIQTRFKNDCIRLGVQKEQEYKDLSDFWADWE